MVSPTGVTWPDNNRNLAQNQLSINLHLQYYWKTCAQNNVRDYLAEIPRFSKSLTTWTWKRSVAKRSFAQIAKPWRNVGVPAILPFTFIHKSTIAASKSSLERCRTWLVKLGIFSKRMILHIHKLSFLKPAFIAGVTPGWVRFSIRTQHQASSPFSHPTNSIKTLKALKITHWCQPFFI